MLKKLRNKLLLICMAITLAVLFAAFIAVYASTSGRINAENNMKLQEATAFMLEASARRGNDTEVHGEDRVSVYQVPSGGNLPAFAVITDENGLIVREIFTLFTSATLSVSRELYEEAAGFAQGHPGRNTVTLDGRQWLYGFTENNVSEEDMGGEAVIRVKSTLITFLDITESLDTLNELLITFVIVGLVMIAVVFLTSMFFANRAIRPVELVWQKQRQFVADASHELKTPLTIISSSHEVLLENKDETVGSQQEWLDYIGDGVARMTGLVNNLLTLARVEGAEHEVVKAPFDLGEALEEVMRQFELETQKKELAVSRNFEPDIVIESDKALVMQVFSILYDNAVKYVNVGGNIDVALTREKGKVICTVGNTGPGISSEDFPKIFDRFYRADHSRSGLTKGHGLGLSIARTVAQQFGGTLDATSEDGYTAFILKLPVS